MSSSRRRSPGRSPRTGAVAPAPAASRAGEAAAPRGFRLPDGSRSVQSRWVWRGLFFMSLVAFGLCLTLLSGGQDTYGILWAVIGTGWFAMSMWLWRQHLRTG